MSVSVSCAIRPYISMHTSLTSDSCYRHLFAKCLCTQQTDVIRELSTSPQYPQTISNSSLKPVTSGYWCISYPTPHSPFEKTMSSVFDIDAQSSSADLCCQLVTCMMMHILLAFFPPLTHFSALLPELPGLSFIINYSYSNSMSASASEWTQRQTSEYRPLPNNVLSAIRKLHNILNQL